MLDYIKDLWSRVTLHWHVLLAALVAAAPSLLDWIGVIDVKPILIHLGLPEHTADFIVAVLPFVLAFLKPMLVMEPKEDE